MANEPNANIYQPKVCDRPGHLACREANFATHHAWQAAAASQHYLLPFAEALLFFGPDLATLHSLSQYSAIAFFLYLPV